MKNRKKQKGITLIALIITVIVMLLLVGVTVNVALNGGLFDTAKEAKAKQEEQTILEQLIGMAQYDSNGYIDIPATAIAIKASFRDNLTLNPASVDNTTNEVEITMIGKHGTYNYKMTKTEIIGSRAGKVVPSNENDGELNFTVEDYIDHGYGGVPIKMENDILLNFFTTKEACEIIAEYEFGVDDRSAITNATTDEEALKEFIVMGYNKAASSFSAPTTESYDTAISIINQGFPSANITTVQDALEFVTHEFTGRNRAIGEWALMEIFDNGEGVTYKVNDQTVTPLDDKGTLTVIDKIGEYKIEIIIANKTKKGNVVIESLPIVGRSVKYKNVDYIVMSEDKVNGTVDLVSANALQVNDADVVLGKDDPRAISNATDLDDDGTISDVEKAVYSYNNAFETLVIACKDATGLTVDGTKVKSIRCVGNTNVKYTSSGITDTGTTETYIYDWQAVGAESDWYTEQGFYTYNLKKFGNNSYNFEGEDHDLLVKLGALRQDNSGSRYWVAVPCAQRV